MKTKTKMKTKLVVSICALTLIFSACKKDAVTPDPVSGCMDATANNYDAAATIDDGSCTYAFTDCIGVENGTAISDDCGDCHKWTAYNYVTHAVREVNDTTTEVLGENEMFASPNNPMNPLWNASCTDCSGFLNGTAIIDDCEDCHKWLAYNYVTHATREVNDTITEVLGANEMFASPNNPANPLWNAGCK